MSRVGSGVLGPWYKSDLGFRGLVLRSTLNPKPWLGFREIWPYVGTGGDSVIGFNLAGFRSTWTPKYVK